MAGLLRQAPVLPLLIGALGVAMLLPAGFGFVTGDAASGRAFLYSGVLVTVLSLFVALATSAGSSAGGSAGRRRAAARSRMDDPLTLLVAVLVLAPLLMAVPVVEAVAGLRFALAWFEMVSSFTTTGATIFDAPRAVPDTVHLWRGLAGWLGGAFVLSVVAAVSARVAGRGLDPRRGTDPSGPQASLVPGNPAGAPQRARAGAGRLRGTVLAEARLVLPVYALVTAAVWIGLVILGNPAFLAFMQAMAAISTSGILPGPGMGPAGVRAEALLLFILALALSRRSLPGVPADARATSLPGDPELRLGAALIALAALVLVLPYWLALPAAAEGSALPSALRAFWGALFTAVSFLTTTGLVSNSWFLVQAWSGPSAPGLVLLGLAMTGGGVATTAGGMKLMRVYALILQGRREMERMVFPSSVGGEGIRRRALRGQAAVASWLFLMLFLLGMIVALAALTAMEVPFEAALVFATAAISTTGPLTQVAADVPLSWAALSDPARAVLGVTMILGRLELLLVLALLLGRGGR